MVKSAAAKTPDDNDDDSSADECDMKNDFFEKRVRDMMEKCDVDKDGVISYEG